MTAERTTQLHTIQEAIEDIRQGKVIIVVDDEDRENEGDFVAAAGAATPEMINFMATHGRGLICAPITEDRCDDLQLNMMVTSNTDPMETAFTVSIDLKGQGVTTGISASDRAKTVLALTDPATKPHDLSRPGHIFPTRFVPSLFDNSLILVIQRSCNICAPIPKSLESIIMFGAFMIPSF